MIEFPHLMQVLMGIVALASLVTTIVMTRGKAASDRVAKLETAIDALESRTTTIEGELRHMPSRDQTHRMELSLQEMRGELAVLNEKLGPIGAISDRLQEFLLEEARTRRGAA